MTIWPPNISAGSVADIVILVALVCAMFYLWRLNGRLKTLKRGSAEMKGLLDDFTKQVDRSRQALDDLQAVAHSAGAALRADIEAAERYHQDLVFALKACEGISKRMEALRSDGRERLAVAQGHAETAARNMVRTAEPAPAPAPTPRPQPAAPARSRPPQARTQSVAPARMQEPARAPEPLRAPEPAPAPREVVPMAAAALPASEPDAVPVQAETDLAAVRPPEWRRADPSAPLVAADATPRAAPMEQGQALKKLLADMRAKQSG